MNKKTRGVKKETDHKKSSPSKAGMMLMEVSKKKASKKMDSSKAKKRSTY